MKNKHELNYGLHLVAGIMGAGKSTLTKVLAEKYCANYPERRVIIVEPHRNRFPKFLHNKTNIIDRINITEAENRKENPLKKLAEAKHCLIILDDAYLYTDYRSKEIQDIAVLSRHNQCYVIAVYQSLNLIPPRLYPLAKYISIFRLNEQMKNLKAALGFITENHLSYAQTLKRGEYLHLDRSNPWHE